MSWLHVKSLQQKFHAQINQHPRHWNFKIRYCRQVFPPKGLDRVQIRLILRNEKPRKKYPNTEFFLVRIFLYSVLIQENTNQKKTPYLNAFHAVLGYRK